MPASRPIPSRSRRLLQCIPSIAGIATLLVVAGISAPGVRAADSDPVIYRLEKSSTFQKGCFAPCMCPVMLSGTERGTFVLTFAGADPLFTNYRVEEVNWTVSIQGREFRVTGSGTYRVGGEFALQEQLVLDLSVDGAAPERFDSGLVAGGGDFPHLGVTISIHGQVCSDTVFGVSASPVPASELKFYSLGPQSRFLRSCTSPCDCPTLGPLPVRGGFTLVPLVRGPLGMEFSVTQVRWLVTPDPLGGDPGGLEVTGSGTYLLGGEVAVQQQMSLDLKLGTDPPAGFESGLVPGGDDFPRVDITVQRVLQTCVTTAFELQAKPIRMRDSAAGAVAMPGL